MSNSKLGGKKITHIVISPVQFYIDEYECIKGNEPSNLRHNIYLEKEQAYEIINSLSHQLSSSMDDLCLQLKVKKVTT
tara:strand:- start:43 stop:276 length:234 start_codon:yes stop_codon:yes gene_type:complete